ncbi:hypothetical protein M9H77_27794 [Catharanthus roseus]|uniref:Uncharacterized protein n=1 Tax=Catharanthus roseus TaxID=4058 RepID=A0ACC0AEJ0_CATRO|nr:hypothetical protein M9H77_27794 [Catharanthus roseus]
MIERLIGVRLSLTHVSGYKGPPLSPTQFVSVMRKFQTIIRSCTPSPHDIQQTFTVQPPHHRSWEPIPECNTCGVKRGTRRLSSGGACGGCAPSPPHSGRGRGSGKWGRGDPGSYVPSNPFHSPDLDALTFNLGLTPFAPSLLGGAGTSYVPPDPFDNPNTAYVQPPPSTGGILYSSPPLGTIGLSFDAPSPPSTAGSSVPHIPISRHNNLGLDIVLVKRLLDLLHLIGVRV